MAKAAKTYDDYIDKRKEYGLLRSSLLLDRASYEPHWMELANFVKPRRTRFFTLERNRGEKRNQKIMDSTATYCLEILRSGMHTGLTSPASPWLQLGLTDPDLEQYRPVKNWLKDVTDRLLLIFEKSNLYNILPTLYGDQALFGTGAMGTFEDAEDLVRSWSYPIGSYSCGMDHRGKVSTFVRDTSMTTRQIVREFGIIPGTRDIDWSKLSVQVKNAWDKSNYETWFDVCNLITPNEDYDPRRLNSKYKRFSSCWFETGADVNQKFLRESGYSEFPVFIPRWETTGEDTYGTECPGMVALGDIKQLQTGEKRSLQAIEKMVNPPTQAPTSMRTTGVNGLPGGSNYVDVSQHQMGVRSLYDMNFAIDKLEEKQVGVRQRLGNVFYTNLFLMMASSTDQQKTAREIAERHEEKLLSLGPVIQRDDDELLNPLVFRHLGIAARAGQLPPPPDEIQGKEFTVTYVSMMHQAQKLIGVTGQERFISGIATLSQLWPEAKAKVNIFRSIDIHADLLSVDPRQIRSDEEAQAIIDQQNQIAAQQHAAETAKQLTDSARNLAQTDVGGDNALTRMVQAAGGVQ